MDDTNGKPRASAPAVQRVVDRALKSFLGSVSAMRVGGGTTVTDLENSGAVARGTLHTMLYSRDLRNAKLSSLCEVAEALGADLEVRVRRRERAVERALQQ